MKKLFRKLKRVPLLIKIIFFVICILYLIGYTFFTKNILALAGIETLIRFILLIILFVYFLIYFLVSLLKITKKKYLLFTILSLITIIFILIFGAGSTVINYVYSKIELTHEKDKITYTSYLISLNETDSIKKIGMISDAEDVEGFILANKIIEKNSINAQVVNYEDYNLMFYALYEKKVDAIFVSNNYKTLFGGEFSDLDEKTKVVYELSEEYANSDTAIASNKSLSEPFSFLILGVDSAKDELDANAAFNGDVLILSTFNPKTSKITMFSIPRDTYAPIACKKNSYYKINSSAAYGTSCVIDTVEGFTGINIDYYVKINFKGVVDLVNAVDGVEVNVEAPSFKFNGSYDCKGKFCEQNSNRDWSNPIYLDSGMQTLNGEEALAYARNRHQYLDGDLARNRHQQEIIMALAQKVIKMDSYDKFTDVLDAISKNIATNMSTNQILSSYNILKGMVAKAMQDREFVEVQKSYLETYNLNVYLPNSNRITMALGYYEESLNDIIKMMKVNLEMEKPDAIMTFSYSANNEYSSYVAGKGYKTGISNSTLADFTGKSKTETEKYCSSNNLSCSFEYVNSDDERYNESVGEGLIGSQNPHSQVLLRTVSKITFYINN